MKKILALLSVTLIVALCFVACKKTSDVKGEDSSQPDSSTVYSFEGEAEGDYYTGGAEEESHANDELIEEESSTVSEPQTEESSTEQNSDVTDIDSESNT